MLLKEKIDAFLNAPFPLWENELTTQLVSEEWNVLASCTITATNYSTARAYFKETKLPANGTVKIFGTTESDSIFIEYPQPELLGFFYEETGLELLNQNEINAINGVEKIQCALEILRRVPGVLDCISQLVKCIGILRHDNPEIDTSHSDPTIPFTIFVSVCEDTSEVSNLRVAESILHEAMHLKLTMIEHQVDLIVPGTREEFYSPWRDEQRPVRGVLHGLFVFKAVLDFYSKLADELNYTDYRKTEILEELNLIKKFQFSLGLTSMGATLTKNLLPLS
jgi:hypothetical protein